MMKNIFKISFTFLTVILLSGCIKETFPKGSTVTKDQLIQSDGALSYMLSGIPSAMMKAGTGGFYSTYGWHFDYGISAIHMCTEAMLEDIAVLYELGYFWYTGFYQNQGMGSDYALCSFFWNLYYEWIKLANDVINVAGEVTEDTPEETKAILGQAYAYRAMYYLDLARIYEPKPNTTLQPSPTIYGLTVPIVTENTTEEQAKNNPRAQREDMYKFILSDLATAEKYLQKSPNNYTAPGLVAVYGLLARTYLELGATYKEMGNPDTEKWDMTSQKAYEKAAYYSRKAIDKGLHSPLTQSQWEDPTNGFNNGATNNAWIWGLTVSSENVSNLIANIAHRSNEALYGYACLCGLGVNLALYNQIPDDDFRKHSWFDPESSYNYKFAGGSVYQNGYLIHPTGYGTQIDKCLSLKFRPAGGNVLDYTTGNAADWCLMRIEEMYFIEIEAQLNLASGGLAKAQSLLNEFMQEYRYESYDCSLMTMTHEAFIKELMLQRRIEFWGEGILFFDYKRLNQGITRGYSGTNIPAVATFNTPDRSPQWNIPITRGEYQSNSGINHNRDNNPDPTEKLILWK